MIDVMQANLRSAETIKHDPLDYGRVAVLLGGKAAEREVSLNSGKAVLAALRGHGIEAEAFDPKTDALERLKSFERVFIVLHGRGGEDGAMQGYLETMGIPYTGSRVLGSAVAMDKVRSKQIWQARGIDTPRFLACDKEFEPDQGAFALNFPVAVKPANEGSSLGMTKCDGFDSLPGAIEAAASFDSEILIEEWVQGAEYTVGILGDKALPLIGIETSNPFYDYSAKYHRDDTRYRCPCGLSPEREKAIQDLALQAFFATAGCGWGRVDIVCDEAGRPYVIEANTVPGMTDHSLLPKAAAAAGIDFTDLVLQILDTSFMDGLDTSVGAMFAGSGGAYGF